LDIFLVAGEESGDQLGARLMAALKARDGAMRFRGVGGAAMRDAGLATLYPMEDLTAFGFAAVIAKLPSIWQRLAETAGEIIARPPDILVLIDNQDFNARLARMVRRALPALAIVKYVSPTIWAWRRGRARAMRPNFDHVLALLPFEPEWHARLGGPPCTYVGHPLLERRSELRPSAEEEAMRAKEPPLLLVLPGSRRTEIARLAPMFGEAIARVAAQRKFELVLPTLAGRLREFEAGVVNWPVRPRIVTGNAEKYAAFRRARAALAASGTVTLELALAHVPTIGAYRLAGWEFAIVTRIARSPSVLLPNLILGENAMPEFIQHECTAENLATALAPLLDDGPARAAQLAAFTKLDAALDTGGETPSARAARVIVETYDAKSAGKPRDRRTN
jgi:lipid-A-disaccharide synthase